MQTYPKHDEDFYGWAMATATLLKQQRYQEVDMDSVIEELEDMGISHKHALISRLAQLLMHLLKWRYQPTLRGHSWKISIRKQRRGIKRLIKENPSLKSKFDMCLGDAYEDARDDAADETGLDEKTFPQECPYTLEQLMDDEFYPE